MFVTCSVCFKFLKGKSIENLLRYAKKIKRFKFCAKFKLKTISWKGFYKHLNLHVFVTLKVWKQGQQFWTNCFKMVYIFLKNSMIVNQILILLKFYDLKEEWKKNLKGVLTWRAVHKFWLECSFKVTLFIGNQKDYGLWF